MGGAHAQSEGKEQKGRGVTPKQKGETLNCKTSVGGDGGVIKEEPSERNGVD
jgi:hypothetical protein